MQYTIHAVAGCWSRNRCGDATNFQIGCVHRGTQSENFEQGHRGPESLEDRRGGFLCERSWQRLFLRRCFCPLPSSLPIGSPLVPWSLWWPAGAGGGSDIFARTVQSIVVKYKLMPQSIVVLNKGGGSMKPGAHPAQRSRLISQT